MIGLIYSRGAIFFAFASISLLLSTITSARPRVERPSAARSDVQTGQGNPTNNEGPVSDSLRGGARVVAVVAVALGQADSVARAVGRIGGEVQVRFDKIGYLRVVVPTHIYPALARLPGVLRAERNRSLRYDDVCADNELQSAADPRPLLPLQPADANNPLFAAATDTRATALQREHPTFDGRGVTIAVIEGGSDCNGIVDVSNPSLNHGRDVAGNIVPKFAGIISAAMYEPVDSRQQGAEGEMFIDRRNRARVVPVGVFQSEPDGSFVFNNQRYLAPGAGHWRLGFYRDAFAVIWNATSRDIWIDSDRDGDLSEEHPLTDFNERVSVARLSPSSGDGEHVDQLVVAFADNARGSVFILPTQRDHFTMSAGVAAGHNLGGTLADTAAPGARIMIVTRTHSSTASHIESLIYALRDPRVDIVSDSTGTASQVASLVVRRASTVFRKIIVIAVGNTGPGGAVTQPEASIAVASEPRSYDLLVGAYVGRATMQAYFGLEMSQDGFTWTGSTPGPSATGGFRPDVLAPLYNVSPWPCSMSGSIAAQQPDVRYRFPACYGLSDGTSAAAPTAAGAIAALLSAFRQTSAASVNTAHLLSAIRSSAQPLSPGGAHQYGYGLINIERAWQLLRQHPENEFPEIRIEAQPIVRRERTVVDEGLFERAGWTPGAQGVRNVRVTRISGPSGPIRYGLRWRSNDGSFASAAAINLELGRSVDVPITVSARNYGIHSAILEIVNVNTGMLIGSMLATVVVAHQFDSGGRDAVRGQIAVRWPETQSVFFEVPAGTQSLTIGTQTTVGALRLRLTPPIMRRGGRGADDPRLLPTGQAVSIVVPSPAAGTWELSLWFCRPANARYGCTPYQESPQYQGDATIIYNAQITRGVTVQPIDQPVLPPMRNRYAITGLPKPSSSPPVFSQLGSYVEFTRPLSPSSEALNVDIDVHQGASSLRVTAIAGDDRARPILQLFDCTTGTCQLQPRAFRREASPAQSIVVPSPSAGRWRLAAVVDQQAGPGTELLLRVLQTSSEYGSANVRLSRSRAAWEATVTAVPRASVMLQPDERFAIVTDVLQDAPPLQASTIQLFEETMVSGGQGNVHASHAQLPLASVVTTVDGNMGRGPRQCDNRAPTMLWC